MTSIREIFAKFNQLNVLIVGDVMIDRYIHGRVSRISPEAPVPIVELRSTENRLGGAGNVALNIKALGATPYLFSVIGDDTEGSNLLQLLTQNDLPTNGILQSSERKTSVKTRIMAGTQQMLRVDDEMTADLTTEQAGNFIKKLRNFLNINTIHVIIFQDYNKGVLSLDIIKAVMDEAQKRHIPTAVDPKKNNFLAYKNATLFKPNLKEIREAVSFEVTPDLASLQRATDYLRNEMNQHYTMITLSEKGLFLAADTEGSHIYPTVARNIADVSGAGDTVVSVAALGLALGVDARTLALLSNLAGGQVCEISGIVPVNKGQLLREFEKMGDG